MTQQPAFDIERMRKTALLNQLVGQKRLDESMRSAGKVLRADDLVIHVPRDTYNQMADLAIKALRSELLEPTS